METPQETQQQLKRLIDEAFDKVEQLYQAQMDAAYKKIEELQALLRIQTDAERDARIRELSAKQRMSVEAWIVRELQHAAEFAEAPMIRVHPDFYAYLSAYAAAKGVSPELLTTTAEANRRFISLIDNDLLNEREID